MTEKSFSDVGYDDSFDTAVTSTVGLARLMSLVKVTEIFGRGKGKPTHRYVTRYCCPKTGDTLAAFDSMHKDPMAPLYPGYVWPEPVETCEPTFEMRCSSCLGAKLVSLIEVFDVFGDGSEGCPRRVIHRYYDPDTGELVAVHDTDDGHPNLPLSSYFEPR
ncbi:hypothetical protein [Oceanospirillum maris]|uniref:hypothetical protein n=1 Tax=Oceanospirillum maris TaxID=64977 RepID=UPI0003F8D2D1|nr:hypothetical protein [Oceanospirillum maris]